MTKQYEKYLEYKQKYKGNIFLFEENSLDIFFGYDLDYSKKERFNKLSNKKLLCTNVFYYNIDFQLKYNVSIEYTLAIMEFIILDTNTKIYMDICKGPVEHIHEKFEKYLINLSPPKNKS